MPVVNKNRRPFLYPKGTKTAEGRVNWRVGEGPKMAAAAALHEAVQAFKKEHGFDPMARPVVESQTFITTAYTTFACIVEVCVFPE